MRIAITLCTIFVTVTAHAESLYDQKMKVFGRNHYKAENYKQPEIDQKTAEMMMQANMAKEKANAKAAAIQQQQPRRGVIQQPEAPPQVSPSERPTGGTGLPPGAHAISTNYNRRNGDTVHSTVIHVPFGGKVKLGK